jgi:predicted kinase
MGGAPRSAQLVVFAGLPGVGKTTVSREVATRTGATFLRIDTIEAAIRTTLMPYEGNPVGYVVAARVAADQLRAGRSVVADAVNGVTEARQGWVDLALECSVSLTFVEVTCSDPAEHRRRVETRTAEMPGHGVPTWAQVRARPWEPFTHDRLTIDTVDDPATNVRRVLDRLAGDPPAGTPGYDPAF